MDGFPLETERLRIRQFTSDDWRAVHAYTSDAEVITYILDWGGPQTEEQARQFVADTIGDEARAFGLILKDEGRLIGHMLFHPWFGPGTYEVGWVLDRRQHGQGYATEAAAALLRHGFETLRLHRIIATCQPQNVPSYRVMEKLGMRREAWFQKCLLHQDGTWWDEYFYALLAEEWFGNRAAPRDGARRDDESHLLHVPLAD